MDIQDRPVILDTAGCRGIPDFAGYQDIQDTVPQAQEHPDTLDFVVFPVTRDSVD